MKKEELFKLFNIEDLKDFPTAVMMLLESDINTRNRIYQELIRMNNYDMSYDWFQEMYEAELSERKQRDRISPVPKYPKFFLILLDRKVQPFMSRLPAVADYL